MFSNIKLTRHLWVICCKAQELPKNLEKSLQKIMKLCINHCKMPKMVFLLDAYDKGKSTLQLKL